MQDSLFGGTHHTTTRTVDFEGIPWWVWDCICGRSSTDWGNKWSHQDLAEKQASYHAQIRQGS